MQNHSYSLAAHAHTSTPAHDSQFFRSRTNMRLHLLEYSSAARCETHGRERILISTASSRLRGGRSPGSDRCRSSEVRSRRHGLGFLWSGYRSMLITCFSCIAWYVFWSIIDRICLLWYSCGWSHLSRRLEKIENSRNMRCLRWTTFFELIDFWWSFVACLIELVIQNRTFVLNPWSDKTFVKLSKNQSLLALLLQLILMPNKGFRSNWISVSIDPHSWCKIVARNKHGLVELGSGSSYIGNWLPSRLLKTI